MDRLLKKIEENRAVVENACPKVLDIVKLRCSCTKSRKTHAACLFKLKETTESIPCLLQAENPLLCVATEKRSSKKWIYMRLNSSLNVYKEPMLFCESYLPLPKPVSDAKPGMAAYAKAYIHFRRIVDLSAEKQVVKAYDMKVFEVILGGTYMDGCIAKFIEKLIEDPQAYGRKERSCFFNIALMAYFYVLKNDERKACLIKGVLKANARFFSKTKLCFDFHLTCDEFIDSLVLSAQRLGDYYGESRFLNLYYKTYVSKEGVSADMLASFMARLAESTGNVPHEYVVGFLKNVFLYDTVIYHTIRADQLVKIVLSFLRSRARGKKEHSLIPIYRFFETLLEAFANSSIFSQVQDEVLRLPSTGKRTQSLRSWFEIKSDVSFEKYRAVIEKSCDSYEDVSRILDDIFGCVCAVTCSSNIVPLFGFLDLLLLIFSSIGVEFLVRLRVKLIKAISRTFLNMQNAIKDCNTFNAGTIHSILRENKRLWPVLSKFVLAVYRVDAVDNTKAKKKKSSRASPTQSSLLTLIEKVKGFEVLLTKKLDSEKLAEGLMFLKNRSFEIRTMSS